MIVSGKRNLDGLEHTIISSQHDHTTTPGLIETRSLYLHSVPSNKQLTGLVYFIKNRVVILFYLCAAMLASEC
jgi:hypothetical protein